MSPPDENPSGLGTFEMPLAFQGSYRDKETNLHYNYYRDYDPGSGRYVESDPIGLKAGLNTYSYSHGNPVQLTDPAGLDVVITYYPPFPPGHLGIAINSDATVGFYPIRKNDWRVPSCGTVPGFVGRDRVFQSSDAQSNSRTLRIKTAQWQDELMQQYINLYMEGGRSRPYNLCVNQCTAFVEDVLGAGGLAVPWTLTPAPTEFFSAMERMYGSIDSHRAVMRKGVLVFTAIGFVIPLLVVALDIATSGRVPTWLIYLWPTSWVFPPLEAGFFELTRLLLSLLYAALNALLYAGVGYVAMKTYFAMVPGR